MPGQTEAPTSAAAEVLPEGALQATTDDTYPYRRHHQRYSISFAVEIEADLKDTEEVLRVTGTTTLVSSLGATLVLNCSPEDFRQFRPGQRVRLSTSFAGTLDADVNATWTVPSGATPEDDNVRLLMGVRITSGEGWRRAQS
jgi:hypothetical protein